MDRAHGALGPLLKRPPPLAAPRARPAKRRDLELEAGARAHFEDPAYYADTYETRDEDVRYYHAVALAHGGPVLEQGIGNGRIALPLARDGVAVTGIDHSAAMLRDLRVRLAAEEPAVRKRVALHTGDLRKKKLGKRFPLVFCPFNTALHFYTREDVEAWLARSREHLAPGGELVFDVSMPLAKDLARDPGRPYRMPPFEHPTAGLVAYREHFDYDPVRQILFVSMFFEPQAGKGPKARKAGEPFMTPLAHRQFFPRELEALLHYNGWEIRELFGDFERGPLVATSDTMLFHVRPRRKR